jgi:hypothetical protein
MYFGDSPTFRRTVSFLIQAQLGLPSASSGALLGLFLDPEYEGDMFF